jgi:hypothetical protein
VHGFVYSLPCLTKSQHLSVSQSVYLASSQHLWTDNSDDLTDCAWVVPPHRRVVGYEMMWDTDWPTSAAAVVVALVVVHLIFRATSPKARQLVSPTDEEVYGETRCSFFVQRTAHATHTTHHAHTPAHLQHIRPDCLRQVRAALPGYWFMFLVNQRPVSCAPPSACAEISVQICLLNGMFVTTRTHAHMHTLSCSCMRSHRYHSCAHLACSSVFEHV